MRIPKEAYDFTISSIIFETNDPDNSKCSINIYVRKASAIITASPKECILGNVGVNDALGNIVNIHCSDNNSYKVISVVSSHPEMFNGVWEQSNSTLDREANSLLGVVRVLHNRKVGDINGILSVYFSSGLILKIPVIGRIVDEIEMLPKYPRLIVNNNKLQATVRFKSIDKSPLSCKVLECYKNMNIKVGSNNSGHETAIVFFEIDQDKDDQDKYMVKVEIEYRDRRIVREIELVHGGRIK
jgi:hypothetical protein